MFGREIRTKINTVNEKRVLKSHVSQPYHSRKVQNVREVRTEINWSWIVALLRFAQCGRFFFVLEKSPKLPREYRVKYTAIRLTGVGWCLPWLCATLSGVRKCKERLNIRISTEILIMVSDRLICTNIIKQDSIYSYIVWRDCYRRYYLPHLGQMICMIYLLCHGVSLAWHAKNRESTDISKPGRKRGYRIRTGQASVSRKCKPPWRAFQISNKLLFSWSICQSGQILFLLCTMI